MIRRVRPDVGVGALHRLALGVHVNEPDLPARAGRPRLGGLVEGAVKVVTGAAGRVIDLAGAVVTRPGRGGGLDPGDLSLHHGGQPLRPPIVVRPAPVPLLRTADLVSIGLTTNGLTLSRPDGAGPDLEGGAPARLLRQGSKPALITLTLPAQSFGEQAFFEATPAVTDRKADPMAPESEQPLPRTARRRQAGTSRLVFRLRATVTEVPYTVEGILQACRDADLVVPATATPPTEPARPIPPWWFDVEPARIPYLSTTSRVARWEETATAAPAGAPVFAPAAVTGPAKRSAVVVVPKAALDLLPSLLGPVERAPSWLGKLLLPKERPTRPGPDETALEAPYRLFLAPHELSAFVHAVAPVTLGGRTELWHSRLAVRPDAAQPAIESPHWLRTVRAVWARTEEGDVDIDRPQGYAHDNRPFRMPLDDKDRRDLVVSSADPTFRDRRAVDAERLHVSALGAELDLHGAWTPPGGRGTGIEEWAHRTTLGRDNYVRVVYAGHLYPTAHRASLVKVTERRFHDRTRQTPLGPITDENPSEATAYLRTRMFLVIREPERAYDALQWAPPVTDARQARSFPFARITMRTRITPDLDDPTKSAITPYGQSVFCPRVNGQDFQFSVTATDVEGNRLDLSMPLYFVSVEGGNGVEAYDRDPAVHTKLVHDYTTSGRNAVSAHGQRLALAPSRVPGDTEVSAERLHLTSVFLAGARETQLGWYPQLQSTDAVLTTAAVLTGSRQPLPLTLSSIYLDHGFAPDGAQNHANLGEVFVELVHQNAPAAMRFSGDGASSSASGGFLSPDLSVRGLSRLTGPVAGTPAALAEIAGGTFQPSSFLASMIGGVVPRLFGCINLVDLFSSTTGIDLVGAAGEALDAAVPSFVTEAVTAVDSLQRDLQQLQREAQALVATAQQTSAQAAAAVQDALATATARVELLLQDVTQLAAARDPAAVTTALDNLTAHLQDAAEEFTAAVEALDALGVTVPAQAVKVLRGILLRTRDVVAAGSDLVDLLRDTLTLAEELRVTFSWSTDLDDWTVFQASRAGRQAHLDVRATVQAKSKLHPEPSADVVCGLRDFTLVLVRPVAEFLSLEFAALEFRSRTGAKPDVNVEFAAVRFLGPLSFVEALRDLIPLDGFSDPPALTVSEQGIAASYSMALPDVAFGVFSLQNLSLGAGFTVPFLGDPLSVRFQFCERQSPFLLTVSCFGGGGFFGLTLTPAGVQTLEASFEFGASLAMDFGVASGGVSVMGGVYYCLTASEGALLTGYLRVSGEVEVLGLVAVSIELSLELAYQPSSGKCVGRATLTVSISVAFFETSVSIECERKFAGSNGDPILAQLVGPEPGTTAPEPWLEYCAAFAPVAA